MEKEQATGAEPASKENVTRIGLSKENAEKAFAIVEDYYDVDPSDYDERDNQFTAYMTIKKRLIRAIRKGRLEITEDKGKPVIVQHIENPPAGVHKTVTWKVLTGSARIAVKDDNASVRQQEFAGAMTNLDQSEIQQLQGPDIVLLEYLAAFFLSF